MTDCPATDCGKEAKLREEIKDVEKCVKEKTPKDTFMWVVGGIAVLIVFVVGGAFKVHSDDIKEVTEIAKKQAAQEEINIKIDEKLEKIDKALEKQIITKDSLPKIIAAAIKEANGP